MRGATAYENSSRRPGFQVGYASDIRKATGMKTMAVGHILDARQAEAVLAEGHADLTAIGRQAMYKNRIMALAELEFINRSEVVHFLGPPGTGKSHLSLALGVQAVKAGRSVYFTPLSDLVSALAKAEREGTLREKIRFFCRFSLLIVDEIGYLPLIARHRDLKVVWKFDETQ